MCKDCEIARVHSENFSKRLTIPFPSRTTHHQNSCDISTGELRGLPSKFVKHHQSISQSFRHENPDTRIPPANRRLTIPFPTSKQNGNALFKHEKNGPNTSIFNSFKHKRTNQKFTTAGRRLTFPFHNRSSNKKVCRDSDIACVHTNALKDTGEKYFQVTKRLTIPFTTRNNSSSKSEKCDISCITTSEHYRGEYVQSAISPSSRRSTIQLPTRFSNGAKPDTTMIQIPPSSKRLTIPFPTRHSQQNTSSEMCGIACVTKEKKSENLFRDYQHKSLYQIDMYETMDKIPPLTGISPPSPPKYYWNRKRFQRTWPHIHRDETTDGPAKNVEPNDEEVGWNGTSSRAKKNRWKIYGNESTQERSTSNRYLRWFSTKLHRKTPDSNDMEKRRRSFPDDLSGYIKWISTRGRHKVNFQWLESEKKKSLFGEFEGLRSNLVKQSASLDVDGKCSRDCSTIDSRNLGSCHLHCQSQCTDNFPVKHKLSKR